jgi:acetolactate synthase I/II/III large subunit
LKLSDYIFQFVAELGIKHVFMLSGGGAMHLDDSLGRCKQIEYVCNLHEQACAIAAEAYAKVTSDLGVALVTTGPGGTNSITGVAGAWLDSTPCLFISGQVKRPDLKGTSGLRQLGVQEVDIVSLVAPITKYAVTVTDPSSIRYHLEKAVYLARRGRPGPVWIDVPLDVQAAPIDESTLPKFEPEPETAALFDESRMREQVAQVVELLNQSERPLLLAGSGIRLARAGSDFLALVDRLAIPAEAATSLGIDLMPGDHPLFFGRPGPIAPRYANFILQNCDLLIAVGARLDMAMTAYAHEKLARGAKKVMVDIDPAEIAKMKTTIHVPVQADAGAFLREFLKRTEPNSEYRPRDCSAWISRCRQWRERYPVVLPEHREPGGMVSTYHLTEVLCQEMNGDDVIASGSSGNAIELFHLCFQHKAGQRVIHTRGLGAMGFGIPAAIGACLAAGRRRTICLDGDGGFHLNIQELETVARLKLPIKFFVINNNGYASIRISQAGYFQGRLCGADPTSGVTLPDLLKISEAYGIRAVRLADQNDLRPRVAALLNEPGPLVVDVMVPPDEVRAPRVISVPRPDGSMVSKPLEDLWPFLPRDEFLSNMIVPAISE